MDEWLAGWNATTVAVRLYSCFYDVVLFHADSWLYSLDMLPSPSDGRHLDARHRSDALCLECCNRTQDTRHALDSGYICIRTIHWLPEKREEKNLINVCSYLLRFIFIRKKVYFKKCFLTRVDGWLYRAAISQLYHTSAHVYPWFSKSSNSTCMLRPFFFFYSFF